MSSVSCRRTMTLRELMGNGAPEIEISGLAYSSQSVTPGTLFFCVPGFRVDGHDFAPDAVERGAVALVCQRPLGLGVPEVVVADVRAAMGPAAARFYGDPTAELDVVGITGTNGKTTTAFLVRHLLEAAGRPLRPAGHGQAGGGRASRRRWSAPRRRRSTSRPPSGAWWTAATGPAPWRSPRTRSSSGAPPGSTSRAAVFTNLTQDHLDFHETMEAYFAAKRRLFDGDGLAVVNVDDPYGRRIAAELGLRDLRHRARRPTTGRATSSSTWWARASGCETPEGELRARIAAAGPVQRPERARRGGGRACAGCRPRRSPRRCDGFGRVPGRFEPVDEGQDFGVLVDYAHTPDSLENVLRAARELTAGPPARGVRRRRRPRPRQAPADGRRRAPAGRPRAGDLGQPAQRGAGRDHRRDHGGRRAERQSARWTAARAIALAIEQARAGRRGGDRRQGSRAGPGVRGRAQGAVRRP